LEVILKTGDENTLLVPGHGKVSSKQDVRDWRDMMVTISKRIQASIDAGNSLEETLPKQPGKEFDDRWSAPSGFASKEVFMTTIYNEISNR